MRHMVYSRAGGDLLWQAPLVEEAPACAGAQLLSMCKASGEAE